MRLEDGDQAPRLRACAPPRAWRAPRSGGGRSRRRPPRRSRVCPWGSKRRPAPVNVASAGAASPARTPAARRRRERGQRVEHVVPPGHLRARPSHAVDGEAARVASARMPSPGPSAVRALGPGPTTVSAAPAGELARTPPPARRASVGGVVVELDVRHHRHLRLQLQERAVGLVGLDHAPTPPRPSAAFVPAARSSPPIRKAGSRPALEQREGDHRRGRRLAVGAGHGDRLASARESSPSRSPRWRTGAPAPARRRELGVVARGWRWRPPAPRPSGRFAASWPIAGSMPAARADARSRTTPRGPSR